MSIDNDKQNRRQWFKAATRWLLLGGCAAGSAVLVARGGNCGMGIACDDCGKLADCELPRAISLRKSRVDIPVCLDRTDENVRPGVTGRNACPTGVRLRGSSHAR